MNFLRYLYADRPPRLAQRARRREQALLASIWASRMARHLGVGEPGLIGRAARYAMNRDTRRRPLPSWFPTGDLVSEVILTARVFVNLTTCADSTRTLLPGEALRELLAHADAYGYDAVHALAAQFNPSQWARFAA